MKKIMITLLSMAAINMASAMDVAVIVSAKSPVTTLTREQVEQLFLGKVSSFPGGSVAIPLDQVEGSDVRNDFYDKAINKSPSQLKAYWSKLVFTGKAQPPKEIQAGEIKKLISTNPNAISYIPKSEVDGSVKVVYTVQ